MVPVLSSIKKFSLERLKRRLHDRSAQKMLQIITGFSETVSPAILVQIGSNDGITNDPFYPFIKKYHWSALLVEPVPYVYERLQSAHENSSNVITVNTAISTRQEDRYFYYLEDDKENPGAPWWRDQIGSFSLEQVLKSSNDIPGFSRYLTRKLIRCITLQQLLDKHGVQKIDIFHTDCEGYDFQVLKQLDFSRYHPGLILYEHKHMAHDEKKSARCFLKAKNYMFIAGKANTLAVAKDQK